MDAPDWKSIAERILQRRNELGLSQVQCVDRSGGLVSSATWSKYEAGTIDNPKTLTKAGVAKALNWQHDAIDLLMEGQEPIELPVTLPDSVVLAERVSTLETTVLRLTEKLDQAVDRFDEMLDELRGDE